MPVSTAYMTETVVPRQKRITIFRLRWWNFAMADQRLPYPARRHSAFDASMPEKDVTEGSGYYKQQKPGVSFMADTWHECGRPVPDAWTTNHHRVSYHTYTRQRWICLPAVRWNRPRPQGRSFPAPSVSFVASNYGAGVSTNKGLNVSDGITVMDYDDQWWRQQAIEASGAGQ